MLNILIVDDERDFAEGLQEVLDVSGYQASVAFSEDEALIKCKEEKFDLALIDLTLDGKNGLLTSLKIGELNPDARLIIMTGHRIEHILSYTIDDGSRVSIANSAISMDDITEQLADAGPQGIVFCHANTVDFCADLKQHFKQQGKTALVVSPGSDGVVGSSDSKVDILILKFSQAPLPEVMKLHISLRRQGYVIPTVMVCDYGADEQSAGTGLMITPVSGCLFKPFTIKKLLLDLQLMFDLPL